MKKSLVATIAAMMIFVGCTEDKKETKVEVKQEVAQAVEKKEELVTKVEEVKAEVVAKIEETKKEVEEVKAKVEEKVTEVKAAKEEAPAEVTQVDTLNGEAIFKTCASCHGQKAEKEALGKSQVIAGWDKQRTIDAMNGYKNGTYGGVMKNIMKPHVESKTDAEIEAVSDFISKL